MQKKRTTHCLFDAATLGHNKKQLKVKAKTILFCGGPFTDELRKLEDPKSPDIVNGAFLLPVKLISNFNL